MFVATKLKIQIATAFTIASFLQFVVCGYSVNQSGKLSPSLGMLPAHKSIRKSVITVFILLFNIM